MVDQHHEDLSCDAASAKNNEINILAFYFKLSQYVIHSVQNDTAINIVITSGRKRR